MKAIVDDLKDLKRVAINSDPHDADQQLNITIDLIYIIERIQEEIRNEK